ncbi:MAG TPA: hypothetical protein VF786_13985, partial [Terriglobales bacterium]
MQTAPIDAHSTLRDQTTVSDDLSLNSLRVCLLVLLSYCSATVFVQAAWALQAFQIGIFVLLAVYLLRGLWKPQQGREPAGIAWLIYLVPFWGVVQILCHLTASTFDTRAAALRWAALAGVFFLSQCTAQKPAARKNLLTAFLAFATAMAVLCLAQLFTSEGKVLWIFSTGYRDVYGTFPSHNSYAQLVELALPIVLWRALREGWRSWWYLLSAGVLYASVIGSASRAGALLCTLELLAMLAIGLRRLRDPETGTLSKSAVTVLVAVPVLAMGFTLAVGWQNVWQRFQ